MRRLLTLMLAAACLWVVSPGAVHADDGGRVEGRVRLEIEGVDLAEVGPMVVYLEPLDEGDSLPIPDEIAVLEQRNARFAPSFLTVVRGQPVSMPNVDAIYHNVFSYSRPNDFDLGTYAAGQSRTIRFEHPGIVRAYCSIHERMSATIFVAPSRDYDIVHRDGRFAIEGIRPGRYRVNTWCEKLPSWTGEIDVSPGATLGIEIPLGGADG